jgi:hypothetical protein
VKHYYNCAQVEMCIGMYPVCTCNSRQCTALAQHSSTFDLVVNGDEMTGASGAQSVVLYRVTPADN